MTKSRQLVDQLTDDELDRLAQLARILDWWYRGGKALAWLKWFLPVIAIIAAWATGVFDWAALKWAAIRGL